jgi:Domain of unknown function (DUF4397)
MKKIATFACSFILGLVAALSFAGCGNGGNDDQTNLRFINALANVDSADLFIDGDMWFQDQGYLVSSDYFNFDTDQHLFQVTPSNSLSPVDNLLAALQDDQDYTYIAVGTASDGDALMLVDNNERAGSGSFKLRIINAIEQLGSLNVYVVANVQDIATVAPAAQGLGYKSVSQYLSGRSGIYDIVITNNATGQVVGTLPDQTFNETEVYTLVLAQNDSLGAPVYPLLLNDSES